MERRGGVGVDAFGPFGAALPDQPGPSCSPLDRSPVMRMWMGVAPG
ncbi:MAG TPA: hypothetical protein VEF72_31040 [Mycobacterium sp.]|nr:hypothetical protein [Mycobacterium sp.]